MNGCSDLNFGAIASASALCNPRCTDALERG
jgi:hypothetical protein